MSNNQEREWCIDDERLSRAVSILKKVNKYPIGNSDSDLEREINDFLKQFK